MHTISSISNSEVRARKASPGLNWLKPLLMVLGFAASLVFLATKIPPLFERLLHPAARSDLALYGDLYRDAKIRAFKPAHPLEYPRLPPEGLEPPTAEVLQHASLFLFGDSFSLLDCGGGTLGRRLQSKTAQRVLSLSYYEFPNPLTFLKAFSPASPRKTIVFEVVEKQIDWRFGAKFPLDGPVRDLSNEKFCSIPQPETWSQELRKLLLHNTAEKHEFLLRNSLITFPVLESWDSLLFLLGGISPDQVPLYSTDPPLLFIKNEVDTFFTPHSDASIRELADHIASLARDLQDRFGCQFVFLPIPDKLSVYCTKTTTYPYDGYLPRLGSELKRRGVESIDLLVPFRDDLQPVYYSTDTHWNERGVAIAVDKLLQTRPGANSSTPSGTPSEPAPRQ